MKVKRDRSLEYSKRKRSPTYRSWDAMIQRCTNSRHQAFKYYGGRGVQVSERWRDFKNFLEDMGTRPYAMTLDRIDCNKHYCKENCRWADIETQNNNRRNSTKVITELTPYEVNATKEYDSLVEELGINV